MQSPPRHVAIIMDGNGRWAKKRHLPRIIGHIKGASVLKKIVQHANDIGINYLTVFAFGRENWQRPKSEVGFLMKLMLKKLNQEMQELHDKNAKIKFLGDRQRIGNELLIAFENAEAKTFFNTGLQFNICFDYSGQHDIIQAINRILADGNHRQIDEQILANYLYTADMPNPELIIRTSGENRLSNFMLWQCAYSELYFTDTLWPDFSAIDLDNALSWYNSRERRFGKTSEQL